MRALRRSGDREDRAIHMLLEVKRANEAISALLCNFSVLFNVSMKGLAADAADEPSESHDR